ncbi:MAG: hypothetical protein ACTSV2_09275 [Candidatus Thorarchaeota archaeon]
MNIIRKGTRTGTINEVRKKFTEEKRKDRDLTFDIGKLPRDILSKMLVVCGKVGKENIEKYQMKANEIDAEFIVETGSSWILTRQTLQERFDPKQHLGVLMIGSNKELPGTQLKYQGAYAFTDYFIQDLHNDGIPNIPVGRIFGEPETVLYHMDPFIIDSDIAIVFDSQPGRSSRHVEGLAKLGFDVEVLTKYTDEERKLLAMSEFILQFSDGLYTSRIHGTPEQWASHNSVIISYEQTNSIKFEGYPVVYSEACSTAQEGPLLKAFLDSGACYIGSTLDTLNNIEQFEDWRDCAYADGYKFGFLDLLDTYELIGQVKMNVDKGITERLKPAVKQELEQIKIGNTTKIESDHVLSIVEWVLFGNPLRNTTVGPDADYTPGTLIVDT